MNGCKRILSIILMSVILTGCSQRSSEIMLIEMNHLRNKSICFCLFSDIKQTHSI